MNPQIGATEVQGLLAVQPDEQISSKVDQFKVNNDRFKSFQLHEEDKNSLEQNEDQELLMHDKALFVKQKVVPNSMPNNDIFELSPVLQNLENQDKIKAMIERVDDEDDTIIIDTKSMLGEPENDDSVITDVIQEKQLPLDAS